ncbi:calcium and integrin-binding protein 1 [Nomia melanderi]|uniref:calcium and integrin-binding protein 1 n=1 Tax=Nomia melanderi TaxID=2448451 RepID=UPI003FCE4A04
MGNSPSFRDILNEETIALYTELTYLSKSKILRIVKLLDDLDPGKLRDNLHHRFSSEQIDKALPQIQCSPFRDSIYRVFSSKHDDHLSLEDVLDLYSAFSEDTPTFVRATWSFYIFDLDGDHQISVDDLIEVIRRLSGSKLDGHLGIDTQEAEDIARMVLQEMVFSRVGTISYEEFIRFSTRIPGVFSSFYFRI